MARKKIYSETFKLSSELTPKERRSRTSMWTVGDKSIASKMTRGDMKSVEGMLTPLKSKSVSSGLSSGERRTIDRMYLDDSVRLRRSIQRSLPFNYVKYSAHSFKQNVTRMAAYIKGKAAQIRSNVREYMNTLAGNKEILSRIALKKGAVDAETTRSKQIASAQQDMHKFLTKTEKSLDSIVPQSALRSSSYLSALRKSREVKKLQEAEKASRVVSMQSDINKFLASTPSTSPITGSYSKTKSALGAAITAYSGLQTVSPTASVVLPASTGSKSVISSAIPSTPKYTSSPSLSAQSIIAPTAIASARGCGIIGHNKAAQGTTAGSAPSTSAAPVFNRKAALGPVPTSLQNLQTPIVGASGTYAGWKAPLNVSTASARRLWSNPFHSLEWLDDDQLNDVINKVITNAQTPGTPESKYITARTIQDFKDRIDYIQNSGKYEGQAILDAKIVDLKRVLRAVDQGVQEEERLGRLAKKAADADTLLTPFMPNSTLANQMLMTPTFRHGLVGHAAMYGMTEKQQMADYAKSVEQFVKRSTFGNVSSMNIPADLQNQTKKDIVSYVKDLESSAAKIVDHHVDSAFFGLRGVAVETDTEGRKVLKHLTESQKRAAFAGALDYADEMLKQASIDPSSAPRDAALYKELAVRDYLKKQEDKAIAEVNRDKLRRGSALALINSDIGLPSGGLIPTDPNSRLRFDMGILGKLGSLARVLMMVGSAATVLNSILAVTAAKMAIAAGDTRTKQRNIFNVGLRSSSERGYGSFSAFETAAYANARRLRTGTSDYIGNVLDLSTALREVTTSAGSPMNIDLSKVMQMYNNLAIMAKVSGTSQADMNGIMVQLLQGIGKGKLDMQDVKPILNRSGVMGAMLAKYGFGLSGRGDLYTELEKGNARLKKTGDGTAGLTATKLVENLLSERTTVAMESYRRSLARTWEEVFTVMKDDITMGLRKSVIGPAGDLSGGKLGSSLLNFSRALGQDEVVYNPDTKDTTTLGEAIKSGFERAFGSGVDINLLGNNILHALGGILYISSMIGKGVTQAVGTLAFIGTAIESIAKIDAGLAMLAVPYGLGWSSGMDMIKSATEPWSELQSLKSSMSSIDSVLEAQKNIGKTLMDTWVNPTKLAENAEATGMAIEELQTSSNQTAENTAKISKNTAKITEIELALLKQVSGQTIVNRVSHVRPNIVTNIGTIRSGIEYKQMLKDIENAVAAVM